MVIKIEQGHARSRHRFLRALCEAPAPSNPWFKNKCNHALRMLNELTCAKMQIQVCTSRSARFHIAGRLPMTEAKPIEDEDA